MVPVPFSTERELSLLVAYSLDTDEEISDAIVNAFLAANIHVFDKPTTLVDWIDTDVLEDLHWSVDRPTRLCTRIWHQHVVVTPEEVRIYTASESS